MAAMLQILPELLSAIKTCNSYWVSSAIEKCNVRLVSILLQPAIYDDKFGLHYPLLKLVENKQGEDLTSGTAVLEEMLIAVISNPGNSLSRAFMQEFDKNPYLFDINFITAFGNATARVKALEECSRVSMVEVSSGTVRTLASIAEGGVDVSGSTHTPLLFSTQGDQHGDRSSAVEPVDNKMSACSGRKAILKF